MILRRLCGLCLVSLLLLLVSDVFARTAGSFSDLDKKGVKEVKKGVVLANKPSSENSMLWSELSHCQDEDGGQSAKTPALLIECLSDRFLTLLKKSKVDRSLQREVVDHGLEVSARYFDFSRMTALAFGRNWGGLTIDQRRKLIDEFRGLLFQNYSAGLSRFLGFKSSVVSSDTNDRQSIVRTSVSDGQPDHATRVDYYLLRIDGRWMIYDVSVSGISLISSYRQQLESVYQTKGFDGVMVFLRQIKKEGSERVVS
ncbi:MULTISPECIES: MlaC/ttg2D family ABC transporter substrate-binding protein [Candidatus Ichthyocystis]|uniref:Putative phospholipid transport system substrate-binding protein n=1 Tax=Candidatus Ichthyocystis hellenicum TaxID=1561003 RepID=A0A0S4LZN6_9BURK|nr:MULTISPECIES: ABC transporter substrate-binding protein [Ichthyocystis]CUT17029.1 putative phospholipid transport system substrate-binding protein [Candidatus Ichthyocystis hellenicum]